jgi:hypothetical protein
MDDFSISTLHESKNEWGARLVTILTPLIIDGYKSILDEAIKLCKQNNESDKYLMTFQNFISRIPKWNQSIIENERKRICEKSGCSYLEDLVTCVHIIQVKILTAMRVGQKQKKIDINIPKLDDFVHKAYINVARKIYKNVYLFDVSVPPLQMQKHNRELEIIVQECILNTLRESIPVEAILKAYMDETIEEDVVEEVREQIINDTAKGSTNTNEQRIQHGNDSPSNNTNDNRSSDNRSSDSHLSFNDVDYVKDSNNNVIHVEAPKSIERLEEISDIRHQMRKADENDDNNKLQISDQPVELGVLDIHNINEQEEKIELLPDLLMDEIEVLE